MVFAAVANKTTTWRCRRLEIRADPLSAAARAPGVDAGHLNGSRHCALRWGRGYPTPAHRLAAPRGQLAA